MKLLVAGATGAIGRPLIRLGRAIIDLRCHGALEHISTILTVDYPPGGSTPRHQHPGTFTTGQMWTEQPHDHHMIAKNASSTEPAKLLVFMIAPHGAQLTTYLH